MTSSYSILEGAFNPNKQLRGQILTEISSTRNRNVFERSFGRFFAE